MKKQDRKISCYSPFKELYLGIIKFFIKELLGNRLKSISDIFFIFLFLLYCNFFGTIFWFCLFSTFPFYFAYDINSFALKRNK